jgi:hypothetical protein
VAKSENFSDRLTPGQIQGAFSSLCLPWRKYFNPDNCGWVNIPKHGSYGADLSVNIYHGGWIDQYYANDPAPENFNNNGEFFPRDPAYRQVHRGDIVDLVVHREFNPGERDKAIEWIREVTGMSKGVPPPELAGGFVFAKDHLKPGSTNKFVQIPLDILKSKIPGNELKVWGAIYNRCSPGDVYSYAGTRRLADDTGLSRPTVISCIHNLINSGLIVEKYRGKNKPPARFPLVASTEVINKKLQDWKCSDPEQRSPPFNSAGQDLLQGGGKTLLPVAGQDL